MMPQSSRRRLALAFYACLFGEAPVEAIPFGSIFESFTGRACGARCLTPMKNQKKNNPTENQNQPRVVAGIDLGTEKVFAAVHEGPVRSFATFTKNLEELRDFLLENKVVSAAMEATGVLWIPVYEMLREAGIECCVVNAAHARNLPARKTDMNDCQWIASLHSKQMLASGFIPSDQIRELRDYWRLRKDHVEMGSAHILHMQKAFEQMNLKIHEVLANTTGASSIALIEAIIAGERSPEALLQKCDPQIISRKKDEMLAALQGHWKSSQLFALQQAYENWQHYQNQIAKCDQKIEQLLRMMTKDAPDLPPDQEITSKRVHHNAPAIRDLDQMIAKLCNGADLQKIPTMTSYTVARIIAEIGTDMSKWATVKKFTAWLGLAPGAKSSGKSKRSQKRFRGEAGKLFCLAARSLANSKYLALGGFYRRIRGKRGGQVANIAAARKIATMFYNTLTKGWKYVEMGLEAYETKCREQTIQFLRKKAKEFGMQLIPEPAAG